MHVPTSQLSPVLRPWVDQPQWLHVSGTMYAARGKNWIFLWFDKKGLLTCWLASSLVTVIILGSEENKRKEEEETGKGEKKEGWGISQSVHGSRRIYLQPKDKELSGRRKRKKKIRMHLVNHLSPFFFFPFLVYPGPSRLSTTAFKSAP